MQLFRKSALREPSEQAVSIARYILRKSIELKATGITIEGEPSRYLVSYKIEDKWHECGWLDSTGHEVILHLKSLLQPFTDHTETIDFLYKEQPYRFTAEFKKTEQGTSVELTRLGNEA